MSVSAKLADRIYPITTWVPGRLGIWLRRCVVGVGFASCGSGVTIGLGVRVTGFANIRCGSAVSVDRHSALHAHHGILVIGNRVSVNTNTTLNAADGGRIELGDDILIAQNVVVRASNHRMDRIDVPISRQGHKGGVIRIRNGVWIAANAIVTADVEIGDDAVVSAGAVVTRDVKARTVVGGVPARMISHRGGANGNLMQEPIE
jgi:galactoside O-acetyltransferase